MGIFDKGRGKKLKFAIANTVIFILVSIFSRFHIEDKIFNLNNIDDTEKNIIAAVVNGVIFGFLSLLTTNILPLTSYL
tara:strand:+ start:188 stop:421 length:234 start_codon:yes stop_codon:yes gene_type:complete